MAIPGVGPVVAAGWLVAALTGAAVGGATGGIIGALSQQAGVSDEEANVYAEGLRRGGALVSAKVDDADAARIQGIMDRSSVELLIVPLHIGSQAGQSMIRRHSPTPVMKSSGSGHSIANVFSTSAKRWEEPGKPISGFFFGVDVRLSCPLNQGRRRLNGASERLASQLMLTARARRQLDWRKAGKFARAPPGVGQ